MKEVAYLLDNKVGTFLKMNNEDEGWRRYKRFKVLINLNMPLRRGVLLKLRQIGHVGHILSTNNYLCFAIFVDVMDN